MRFRFDTTQGFGHITHEDFIHHPIEFFPESHEQEEALEVGLLPDEANPDNPMPWFIARSTRICVADYEPTKTVKRLAKKIEVAELNWPNEINLKSLTIQRIYAAYNQVKGFTNPYDIKELLTRNYLQKKVLLYYHEGEPIGALILRVIGSSMLSMQFVWDYTNHKLSLGTVSQYFEVEYAKQYGFTHIYLMPAYEKSCLYKANFKGLEWFTGSEWSRDTEQLKQLCLRDEQFIVTELPFQLSVGNYVRDPRN